MMNRDEPALPHVGEQDADNAEWKIQVGGEVGHRGREAAQPQQHQVLGLETVQVGRGSANGGDHRYQVKCLAARAGPAADERVGTDNGPGFLVKPPVVCRGHAASLRFCARGDGPGHDRQMLSDPRDQDRHLVGDKSRVSRGRGQHGQAAALARGRYEQEL
jgi:hypothetical protein